MVIHKHGKSSSIPTWFESPSWEFLPSEQPLQQMQPCLWEAPSRNHSCYHSAATLWVCKSGDRVTQRALALKFLFYTVCLSLVIEKGPSAGSPELTLHLPSSSGISSYRGLTDAPAQRTQGLLIAESRKETKAKHNTDRYAVLRSRKSNFVRKRVSCHRHIHPVPANVPGVPAICFRVIFIRGDEFNISLHEICKCFLLSALNIQLKQKKKALQRKKTKLNQTQETLPCHSRVRADLQAEQPWPVAILWDSQTTPNCLSDLTPLTNKWKVFQTDRVQMSIVLLTRPCRQLQARVKGNINY